MSGSLRKSFDTMGPKKDRKESFSFQETRSKDWSLEGLVNSESWRCVVSLAVEKEELDTYALKEFMEESVKGRRQDVSVIDYETFVLKILNDFANGELPYKYKFLLNFSSLFQEAVDYIKNKFEVPTAILVKIVKALLLYIKEENLMRSQSLAIRNTDPIKAMAERTSVGNDSIEKKKDIGKRGNGLKVRPPSITKQDTKLLKRGERAKDDQCIDDAPRNGYFNHYVLLTGFLNPEFPLELIKAGIPLHGLLCIDTSHSGFKWEGVATIGKFSRRSTLTRAKDIQNFWSEFLKKLWNPAYSNYFRDTVFQMYVPRKLLCDRESIQKFLYKEISYLMYDLSDLKRQLNNYLSHIHLWNVKEKDFEIPEFLGPNNVSNECVSVPIMLQCIINTVCDREGEVDSKVNSTSDIDDSDSDSPKSTEKFCTHITKSFACQDRNTEPKEGGDYNLLNIYYKIKELDMYYDLDNRSMRTSASVVDTNEEGISEVSVCDFPTRTCGENMENALLSSDTIFHMLWKKHKYEEDRDTFEIDYCLYASLMTKVNCPYLEEDDSVSPKSFSSTKSNNFETIKNLGTEMRKPHFTITEGSRSIIRSIPYNLKSASRDFFCPEEFKVVSPEKLKASSAPQFRLSHGFKVQTLYTSEIFSKEVLKNPYESLKGFVSECVFSKSNDFDCIEFLSKTKLLQEEKSHWSNYNCVDNMYCVFNDCILLMLHNRKDGQNFQHETFNQKLRTPVGLRDFYEYVLEDEAEWLALQEESYQAKVFLSNKVLESNSLRDFSDSDFWLTNSLKYEVLGKRPQHLFSSNEVKIAYSSIERLVKPLDRSFQTFVLDEELEGYDLSNMAVQYSGLKTVFYTDDCSVAVQLIERLYGDQDLGVHVTQACHTLHLHSYVCPEPHVSDPFTFHVTYRNGIIVAFCRRFSEVSEDFEEKVETPTTNKVKRSWGFSSIDVRATKAITDEEFLYDLGASLPNGLCIRTVRRIVKPCYIKQYYVGKKTCEKSRLFLPSGEMVKIMADKTVQIFKANASIATANLENLVRQTETGKLKFLKYEFITEEGLYNEIEKGSVKSSYRYQTFQNRDSSTNRTYFRRRDGTNYLLQNDGSVCVEFKDGTKMSSSVFTEESKPSVSSRSRRSQDSDFVVVHLIFIAEHPDYATVIYNTETMKWKILLPSDSSLTVYPNGQHLVEVDKRTHLKVERDLIYMNQFSQDGQPRCAFTADLSVFENPEESKYCHLQDTTTGKTFVVEGNANCYITESEAQIEKNRLKNSLQENPSSGAEISEFIGSTDLQDYGPTCKFKGHKLSRENKYFVVRRDLTGMEVLHVEDVNKVMRKRGKGTLLFTQNLPDTENRCFVLISPVVKKKFKNWQVKTILPNPKYDRRSNKLTVSSTYGLALPPTWLHPFPKTKKKFKVPNLLTCRVFIETKRTKLSPPVGTLDCSFCEMDDKIEVKYSQIPPRGVEEYLRRLANNNQNMLKEMYAIAASTIINEKKKLKQDHAEKLKQYLAVSEYFNNRNEYCKNCIRFKIVPNYFQHPQGMTWSILNDLLLRAPFLSSSGGKSSTDLEAKSTAASTSCSFSESYSYKEIEYDLLMEDEQSYSSLSYRSNLSAKTAPPILRTVGLKCKVQPVRKFSSCQEVKPTERGVSIATENIRDSETETFCDFQQNDIERLHGPEVATPEKPPMCFEDLMYLGFV